MSWRALSRTEGLPAIERPAQIGLRRNATVAEPKFEKDLEKLEQIVASLEEGGLPLDDSLKKFEEGVKLAKRCEKALSSAEKKIEILTKNAQGDLKAEPFGEDPPAVPEEKTDAPDGETEESEDEGGLLF